MTIKYLLKITLLGLALLLGSALTAIGQTLDLDEGQEANWARFYEEHETHKLMLGLSQLHKPQYLALQGVNVIPMTGGEMLENQTVVIRNGRFWAMGPADEVPIPPDTNVISNAAGKYMIPGLTEGHSHTQISLSQFLVYLTRGVTTLREMDGFPWMLRAKAEARLNKFLIPNLYVSGHILSHRAWDFFMTQIDDEEDAREAVRQQAEAGYDFIKIHNSMPEPMFSAIFDEANKAGLDVVGHMPNEILIRGAVAAGMRTNEHFKGYLFDETLQITEQDYVSATAGSDLWNAPSFSNYHEHLRGAEARRLAEEENSLRLVPRWQRKGWFQQADQKVDKLTELRQTIFPKSKEIFKNLWPVTQNFFAGTDTGFYAFMVPGYALQEEVRIFESLGLSPYQALETATINPALAMRKEKEMGSIEIDKRADFVILNDNPLEGTENLASIWGVGLRGIWLHRDTLEEIEDDLANIFSENTAIPEASVEVLTKFVEELELLHRTGFPYPDYSLEEIENLLKALSLDDLAARVDLLQVQRGVPIQTP